MEQFTPEDIYDVIGLILAISAILIIGYHMIVYYAENQPIYDPQTGMPDQQEIAAEHVEKVGAKIIRPEQFRNIGLQRDWEMVRRHDAETERRLMACINGMHQGDKP